MMVASVLFVFSFKAVVKSLLGGAIADSEHVLHRDHNGHRPAELRSGAQGHPFAKGASVLEPRPRHRV